MSERGAFHGEVVLITGGSGGIGLATARRLARAGARIYLAARSQDTLCQAAAQVDGNVHVIQADVARSGDVARLAETLERAECRLDVLINCAGSLELGPAETLGAQAGLRLMQVNYLGAARAIDACLPLLRAGRRRSIVNVCSLAGRLAPPYMAAYAASKFALSGYTLALRQELRRDGFHVGLVYPGPVESAMTRGRVGGTYYPLPPLVPVIAAEAVAGAVVGLLRRRGAEVTVPRRLGPIIRLLAACPELTDVLYRWLLWRRRRGNGRVQSLPSPGPRYSAGANSRLRYRRRGNT